MAEAKAEVETDVAEAASGGQISETQYSDKARQAQQIAGNESDQDLGADEEVAAGNAAATLVGTAGAMSAVNSQLERVVRQGVGAENMSQALNLIALTTLADASFGMAVARAEVLMNIQQARRHAGYEACHAFGHPVSGAN